MQEDEKVEERTEPRDMEIEADDVEIVTDLELTAEEQDIADNYVEEDDA